MRIGILGSGLMGGEARDDLRPRRSRGDLQLRARAAGQAGAAGARSRAGNARSGTPAEAAAGADAVLLAVHWNRGARRAAPGGEPGGQGHRHLLAADERRRHRTGGGPHLVGGRGARAHGARGRGGVGFRQRSRARCCSAFSPPTRARHPAEPALLRRRRARETGGRAADSRCRVRSRRCRCRSRLARYIEPFTLLVALLAYEGEGGPELAYRFEHIG